MALHRDGYGTGDEQQGDQTADEHFERSRTNRLDRNRGSCPESRKRDGRACADAIEQAFQPFATGVGNPLAQGTQRATGER